MFHVYLDYFQKPPLGGRPNTKHEDRGTPHAHNHWLILSYHVWRPTWIKIHWNSIWLRAKSHVTAHYTWGFVTALHDLGGVLGRPLDTFSWALTISWSRLLARVWSSPNYNQLVRGSKGIRGSMSHWCLHNLCCFILFLLFFFFSEGVWSWRAHICLDQKDKHPDVQTLCLLSSMYPMVS
jgi:hypothetical protein